MRWTHSSQHRMETSADLFGIVDTRVYPIPDPRIEQFPIHELPSNLSYTYGYLDQARGILREKRNKLKVLEEIHIYRQL